VFLEDLFARDPGGAPVFAELWLVVPEGNGKTTFFALVALYTIEFRPEAWVPVAASARDQAVTLTYRIASGLVERNSLPFKRHPGYREIHHLESKGALKIYASDAAGADGVDPDLAIIEELHRLTTLDLYETWSGKLEKSQGQLVVASTAGAVGSPFEQLRTQIRQSAEDVRRDGCFVRAAGAGVVLHDWAVPEDGDVENLELVAAANPSPRITVETLRKKRAKLTWSLPHWSRFTANRATRSGSAAITEREWADALAGEQPPAGAEWWVGLDVGWRQDTTAFVPLCWVRDDFRLLGPAEIVEPPRDGSSTAVAELKRAFARITDRVDVSTVVMDMNRAEDIGQWLSDEVGLTVIDRAQTARPQAEDYERFMSALRQGWLRHSGDAGLRQHAFNAVAKVLPDGGAKFARPSDARNPSGQRHRVIDALVAAAMVHSVWVEQRQFAVVPWRAF
jgi:phage terminase large subunit-like protein